MKDIVVRIQSLVIEGYKSIGHGEIVFDPESKLSVPTGFMHGNVKGVYGQNGSGKTSVIEVVRLLKKLWTGQSINEFAKAVSGETLLLRAVVFILDKKKGRITKAAYELEAKPVELSDDRESELQILKENLEVSVKNGEEAKFGLKNKFKYHRADDFHSTLKLSPKLLQAIPGASMLEKAQILAELNSSVSSMFSQQAVKLLNQKFDDHGTNQTEIEAVSRYGSLIETIETIRCYAQRYLLIIEHRQISDGGTSQFLHLSVLTEKEGLRLSSKTSSYEAMPIERSFYEKIRPAFKQIDLILNALVPSVHFVHREESYEKPDGTHWIKVRFYTKRGERYIDLKDESEGIRRLISVISEVCTCFNCSSYFLLIDEFDSSIFEYLLGELLEVLQENGKGQFLFTAHNLRPFEVLDYRNIILTTAEPECRFIPFKRIQANNNARDTYYRMIFLDDSDVSLFEKTKPYKIRNALFKAGNIEDEKGEEDRTGRE